MQRTLTYTCMGFNFIGQAFVVHDLMLVVKDDDDAIVCMQVDSTI